MTIDFAGLKSLNPEILAPQWLPSGKKVGNEWVATNPRRADKTPGSFSINLRTGIWKDFAGGPEDGGSDMVSLYSYLHGVSQADAARQLGNLPTATAPASTRVAELPLKRCIFPVPDGSPPPPSFRFPGLGEPSKVWTYLDSEARTLLHVCRYDTPEGKEIRPLTWCDIGDGTQRWAFKGLTGKDPRPIYGLNRLADSPDADVFIFEGEKTTDAAALLVDGIAISWLGGSSTAPYVSLKALAGRRVVLIPDFDAQRRKPALHESTVDRETLDYLPLDQQPGMKGMLTLAARLRGSAESVHVVGYAPGSYPGGWDAADALADGWTRERFMALVKGQAVDPQIITSGETKAQVDAAPEYMPMSVGLSLYQFPDIISSKIQNTLPNIKHLLDSYGIRCNYNLISKDVEIAVPGTAYTVDNADNCALADITSLCHRNGVPTSALDLYIKRISDLRVINPVLDWISSRPWDGTDRIPALGDTLKSTPAISVTFKTLLLTRWLISAVAAVAHPRGFYGKGVLVLQGSQSLGKTAWFRSLVPPELSRYVKDGAALDPANRDSVSQCISFWIVELGEIDATFRKSDIARLKAFLTLDSDIMRRPYDRKDSRYPRRSVFGASVNDPMFLTDDTGNTRWWTIPCISVDAKHGIDMQQLWAQILTDYKAGERWWLDRDEEKQLDHVNDGHLHGDPIEDLIAARLDWDCPRSLWRRTTATDVVVALGFDKPTKAHQNKAASVLRALTGNEFKKAAQGIRLIIAPPMLQR